MKSKLIAILMFLALVWGCKNENSQESLPKQSQKDTLAPISDKVLESAVLYEANIRQYSPEGSFEAFTQDIPKLKELGVKIIWLMPVYPISKVKRKAADGRFAEEVKDPEERKKILGSYYAVSDYTAVNPEYGSMQDFQQLVETAHENGMYVILDWVANHTGWDNKWIKEHPDFYTQNEKGEIIDPINPETGKSWGWTDTADLNYANEALRDSMRNSMKYWVKEHHIDGFRCDVAGEVPTDFWEKTVKELKEIKPVFMLAESEDKDLFKNAFDMGYNWEGHHIMNAIAQGKKNVKDWRAYMQKIDTTYEKDDFLMNFVTNHDENAWSGTVKERMGDAAEAMLALTYTIPGMPLIYSGQEYDMDKRLKFFEKDSIPKAKGKVWPLLEKLGKLKNKSVALHGAKHPASYKDIENSAPKSVLSFKRENNGKAIYYLANMTSDKIDFTVDLQGNFSDLLGENTVTIKENLKLKFNPWEYKILIKN